MSYEVELATKIYKLELDAKELDTKVKALKDERDALVEELKDLLLEEGKNSTGHISGVGDFKLKRESYPNVAKEDMPQFMEWLKHVSKDEIIKEVVEPGTARSFVRDEIESLTIALGIAETHREKFILCANVLKRHVPNEVQKMLIEDKPADVVAAKVYEAVGAKVFQEVKLSHTGKGKA